MPLPAELLKERSGNNAVTMANEVTVIFSGSSAETVACAKAFWLSIHPPPRPKSALVVTGINHRFPTASNTDNGL